MYDDIRQEIGQQVHTLAKKKEISDVGLEWRASDFYLAPGLGLQPAGSDRYPLVITVGKISKTVMFTEEELDDGYGSYIEKKLTECLNDLVPAKRKIGFQA